MDVKNTFLNGNLDEQLFMDQPEGFMVEGKEHMMCKLKRSICRLKQASKQWYILSAMIPSHLLVLKKTLLIDVYT